MLAGNFDVCKTYSVNGDLFHRWANRGEDDVLYSNLPKWKRFAKELGERLGRQTGMPHAMYLFVYAMEAGAIEAVRGHWRGKLTDPEVLDAVMAFVRDDDTDLVEEVLADSRLWDWHKQLAEVFSHDRRSDRAYFVKHDDPSCWRPDDMLYGSDYSNLPHISFENVPQWTKLAERIGEHQGSEFNFASVFDLFMSAMADDVFEVDGIVWKGCVHSDEVVGKLIEYMKSPNADYVDQYVEPEYWDGDTMEYQRCKELGLSDWRKPSDREHVTKCCDDDAVVTHVNPPHA